MNSQAQLGWAPDTDDYSERKGTGSLLQHALRKSGAKHWTPISDQGGVCAYETGATIIVAKKEPYGNILSISNHILLRAQAATKRIVLYLGKHDCFYLFEAEEILHNTVFENRKDGILMNNFHIKLGTRLKV